VGAAEDLERAPATSASRPERLRSLIKGLRRALGEEANRVENVRGGLQMAQPIDKTY